MIGSTSIWTAGMGLLLLAAPAVGQRDVAPAAATAVAPVAPAPWLAQDPGDSAYRAARTALNRGEYRAAVRQFRELRDRFPRSGYVGDTYYWEAFALSKLGSKDELRSALTLLDRQAEQHPQARTLRDARELRVRIQGQLAQLGDAASAAAVAEAAAPPASTGIGARGVRPVRPVRPVGRARGIGQAGDSKCSEEDDERLYALNALLQMRAEQALPILRQVLERRDEGSVCLRRQAVFLVSQKRSDETAAILLAAARGDPDPEVRENAVFWLSQVNSPEAVAALDSILQHATDQELQGKAVFALGQQRSPEAARALRANLERADLSNETKKSIIFSLGQRRSPENAQYLKDFYGKTSDQELKEQVLFALSQMRLEGNADWLLGIAKDENESMDVRKNALFWAGQMHEVSFTDISAMYNEVQNREMKEQLIFVLSQRHEKEAVDQLMAIARTETDRDLRKNAIFWLSQSRDPRVAQFLLEIINK